MRTDFRAFHEAVKQWQRAEGATCTICHQNNMATECHVCHWWGKVPPDGFTPKTPGPKIKDYLTS